MGVLRNFSPIAVRGDFSLILAAFSGVCQIFDIISHGQNNLVCDKTFVHQIKNQKVCHLLYHQPCLFKRIGALQNLTGANAVGGWLVRLYLCQGAGFVPPRMVYEQFRIDSEQVVKQVFIIVFVGLSDGTSGNIAHGEKSVFLQFFRISPADSPKIRQRCVAP